MTLSFDKLIYFLKLNYNEKTCYSKVKWDITNPSLGHCAVASLIIQDYFSGKIAKIKVDGISHYFNIIDTKIVDVTKDQFKGLEVSYTNYIIKDRNELLCDTETFQRYTEYKLFVENSILKIDQIENNIFKCLKCNDLAEKFPELETIHYGKDHNILLLGEAPANNGWRKSHQLWKNTEGKILPSGVILQKLFNPMNISIFDISFIEAMKCFPKERKSLKNCSSNCQQFLKSQIEILKPKIIIPLGESATRSILKEDFKKFKDVVGKTFYYENTSAIIIPIYHPSPVSPNSYKGNIDIFVKIKKVLEKEDCNEKL